VSGAVVSKWNSDFAFDAARRISSITSLYCGPASAAWIAAIWNQSKGRQYDLSRLKDKNLFPDGPRLFHGRIPGFQLGLNGLLQRETAGELRLADEFYFRIDSIHLLLKEYDLPVIIRAIGPNLRNGLHYVVAYRSEISDRGEQKTIQLFSQDNGLLGVGNSGLHTATYHNTSHLFMWGAKRVVVCNEI
jgi:hypothetical protein